MIAIVIPYYKKTFFKATLNSLYNQTDKRFKVYIGDDGSPEDPSDIISNFEDKLNIVYYKFQDNLGKQSLVNHWQRCLKMLKDEKWVTIFGDDDIYSNTVIASFYEHIDNMEKTNCTVVRFATEVINENDVTISGPFLHPEIESGIDFLNRKFTKQTRSSLSEYFFKHDIIRTIGFVDLPLAWHSDDLAVYQFAQNKKLIYSINDALVKVRVSNRSITGSSKTSQQKALATQIFLLKYLLPLNRKINRDTVKSMHKKLEHNFTVSNSNRFLWPIIKYYLQNLEFYALFRFLYIQKFNKK